MQFQVSGRQARRDDWDDDNGKRKRNRKGCGCCTTRCNLIAAVIILLLLGAVLYFSPGGMEALAELAPPKNWRILVKQTKESDGAGRLPGIRYGHTVAT